MTASFHPPADVLGQVLGAISGQPGYQPERQGNEIGGQTCDRITALLPDQVAVDLVGQFVAQDHGQFIIGAAEIQESAGDHDPARGGEGSCFTTGPAGHHHQSVLRRQVHGIEGDLFSDPLPVDEQGHGPAPRGALGLLPGVPGRQDKVHQGFAGERIFKDIPEGGAEPIPVLHPGGDGHAVHRQDEVARLQSRFGVRSGGPVIPGVKEGGDVCLSGAGHGPGRGTRRCPPPGGRPR